MVEEKIYFMRVVYRLTDKVEWLSGERFAEGKVSTEHVVKVVEGYYDERGEEHIEEECVLNDE